MIKDVRGRGLLQGIEIEGSQNADKYVLGQEFYETMLRNGLITELESRRNLENVVVVMPVSYTHLLLARVWSETRWQR